MALSSGDRLGPYEVLAPIGAGGMGEVFRARDTRLEREVAVKVLPERVAKDPEALARFEREARTVAGLNDPHVCSLFDVGSEGDVHYAVFELLEGETLREQLSRGPLAPLRAVELAVQLCEGLAAAHARGIVHRDLKPENLFLTKKGLKILDFGLAKPQPAGGAGEEGLSEEATLSELTSPGVAPGTAAYMSPEQARGEAADARSDIFATGVVLFEMLSGQRPFRRATHAETLTAIIREEPPELTSPGGPVLPGLERIVRRCLAKDPVDRFQSAHDLAFALEAVSGVSAPARPKVRGRSRRVWGGVMVIAAIAVTTGLWNAWPRETPSPALRVRPITSTPGVEMDPALSPDGRQVAFVKGHEGVLALYVKLVDGGESLLVSQSARDTFSPAWSPDGLQIAFLRYVESESGGTVRGVFTVPALGGAARRLETSRASGSALAWSPDGGLLAINDREAPDEPQALFLLSLESGERRRLTTPPAGFVGDSWPRFSPDGRTLAFVRAKAIFDDDIYVVAAGGGEERRLTKGNYETSGLDWTTDGRNIVFSSWRKGGVGEFSLWRVSASGGDPEPLKFGERGTQPTVSRGNGRLTYVQHAGGMDIWRVPGPAASEEDPSPTRFISSTRFDYHADYSPDGQQIAFISSRSGAGEVWVCEGDGSNPRQITFLDDPMTINPSWSPDRERIAFTSPKEGNYDVYVVSASGGVPRRLTTRPSPDIVTSWSRDGRWIYFHSDRGGRREVWRMSPDGGDPVQITALGGTFAFESLDGHFLYYSKATIRGGPPGIWRTPKEGGEEVQLLDRGGAAWWTVLERGILNVDFSSDPPILELFDPARGEVSWAAPLEVPVGASGLTVSPDDRWVLYTGEESGETDIMLVENFEWR